MAERQWTASDFDYPLPPDLVAQVPSGVRGQSRLLVVERAEVGATLAPRPTLDSTFSDLPSLMAPGDLLVVNATRVRHARLLGTRPGGGPAEILLIHPATDDRWVAMGKPGRAMQPGKQILLGDGVAVETVAVLDDGMREVRFVGATAADAIARFGRLPLPPYIDRDPTADDETRYQTVYADREGSVAAPTAGLHFTTEMLAAIRERGVAIAELDLEVGPGTFRPVEGEAITEHVMHAERFEIPVTLADAIVACRQRGGSVWAVGTTVVRALESAARDDGTVTPGHAETRLMITPGYHFRVVDRLITNFHLPRSTLLMLVAAVAGYETTMAAYRHAVAERYRFYSYGDAMCIL
ncbi:MAG: tRNA preQ1(34) S-adenosylmethionine ribosyltransferase-isomerase QueA [Gemmatimonadota bacterium]